MSKVVALLCKNCHNFTNFHSISIIFSPNGSYRNEAYDDVKIYIFNENVSKPLKSAYRANEGMKKRSYNERILQIEHGTFTPLIFSSFGGAGFEADRFLKKLNEKLAEKLDESLSIVTNYTRIKYNFALLRTTLLCIRGSRSHKLSAM